MRECEKSGELSHDLRKLPGTAKIEWPFNLFLGYNVPGTCHPSDRERQTCVISHHSAEENGY